MKYMVQFEFTSSGKASAIDVFERLGPNRTPGVSFRSAWIGRHGNVAFVLVESEDEELVAKAAQSWRDFGELTIHPVNDIEQY